MISIQQAHKKDSAVIATMIMEAMNHECCQWFAGPEHTLSDFHKMMTSLVECEDSQYSYRNTLKAITKDGTIVGICVSYDGARLHELRKAFVSAALEAFGIDYSNMEDETQAGELYIDSLCVHQDYRHQGIATMLLKATIDKGQTMGLPTGLLVDVDNPGAEALYNKVGFRYEGDNSWGGHDMHHLVAR
jgi:ribosomal protein S18 acetylase RimI-like enzyme